MPKDDSGWDAALRQIGSAVGIACTCWHRANPQRSYKDPLEPSGLLALNSHKYLNLELSAGSLSQPNNEIILSMSLKGDCWENAIAESFFDALKVELVYLTSFELKISALSVIHNCAEKFYNSSRTH